LEIALLDVKNKQELCKAQRRYFERLDQLMVI
jgi:hypothetical protein